MVEYKQSIMENKCKYCGRAYNLSDCIFDYEFDFCSTDCYNRYSTEHEEPNYKEMKEKEGMIQWRKAKVAAFANG